MWRAWPAQAIFAIGTLLLSAALLDATLGAGAPAPVGPGPRPVPAAISGPLAVSASRATVVPAATAAGQRRRRSRVVVPVQVRNAGAAPMASRHLIALQAAGHWSWPDAAASAASGALDLHRPLQPGELRSGDLRFELAGPATDEVLRAAELALRVRAPGWPASRLEVDVRPGG